MVADDLFEEVRQMPDPDVAKQFDELVGLDHLKSVLLKEARLVLVPGLLEQWSREKHKVVLPCVEQFHKRSPLIIFTGDVGTGKTTLANSIGDPVARNERVGVTLFRLNLTVRGKGAVGEMTNMITQAFDKVSESVQRRPESGGKSTSAAIFVIDEADAFAESRDVEQMHHEDRAGVNALISGIDRLARERLPVLVILCTNRGESLDPAVLRRAAIHHKFERPDVEQREKLFRNAFNDTFDDEQYTKLARLTGNDEDSSNYGYTYSDITQKLVHNVIREAFPDNPVDFDLVRLVITQTEPTRPFGHTDGKRG